MTASIPIFSPMVRVTDANGDPVANGTVEFYNAGTSTAKTVYADKELSTSLGTTVSTDSGGYPVTSGNARTLVYTGTDAFKMIVKDSSGSTLVTHDNVPGAVVVPDAETSALSETPIVSKTTTYTVVAGDQGTILNCNCTSASFAVTLLSAVTAGDGFEVTIRHVGTANQVTVRSSGTETISHAGKASYAVALKGYGQTITLVSDGANWQTKASSPPRMLDGVPFFVVADRLTATPTSPTPGARYIITGSPTGAWSTLSFSTGQVAEADGNGSWFAYTPADGWTAYVEDENVLTQYRDSTWTDLSNVTAPSTSVLKTARYELQYANGTGGGTPTAGTFTNDALANWVEVSNTTSSVTMATGVWTFAAGTYLILYTRIFYNCNDFQVRFKSTTTSTAITSPSGYTNNGGLVAGSTVAAGFLTLAGSEAFSPQYLAGFAAANGLGLANASSSDVERYGGIEIIDLTSIQGPQGSQGTQGTDGVDAGYAYQWSTSTSGDPGSGKIAGNNATVASITELQVSETDANSVSLASIIATWDDSTSSVKARITITKEGSGGGANKHVFSLTGAGTDQGTYWTFPVSYVSTAGTISNADSVSVLVLETGDKGDTGATGATGSTGATGATGSATSNSTFLLTGIISPTQITANQDDYSPTGLSTSSTLRLSSDASRDITGLAGGADGRIMIVHNVGSQNIVLKDESGSSTAANRFALTSDVTLAADAVAVLQYDATSSRWRAVSGGGTIALGSITGFGTGVATFLATPSSANLLAAVTDETGSGALVFGTSPTFTTSIITPVATITQGTITADAPQINGTVTWNNAGVNFTGWKLNVTDTASAAASLLFDLQVGGTSKFQITKGVTGVRFAKTTDIFGSFSGTNNSTVLTFGSGGSHIISQNGGDMGVVAPGNKWVVFDTSVPSQPYVSMGTVTGGTGIDIAGDVRLVRDAAAILAIRGGTTAQTIRIYSTYTDASNYERGALNAGSDYIELAAETAGTGDDNLDVRLTPAGTGAVRFGSHSAIAAETVTGYITIKDSGGTTRKIAVVS